MRLNNHLRITFFLTIIFFSRFLTFTAGQRLALRHYSVNEGLPAAYVQCIYQDSRGYMWFGTVNGAGRFDGKQFRNFQVEDGLVQGDILDITEDMKGNIWLATKRGGLTRLSPDQPSVKNSIKNYTTDNGLISNIVTSIAEDRDGSLWFGTNKGISRFNGRTFSSFTEKDGLLSNIVFDIMFDRSGRLWAGTMDGVNCYTNRRWIKYTSSNGKPIRSVTKIFQDSRGRIWICTELGLHYFRGGRFYSLTKEDGLISNNVRTIVEDPKGNIWLGTDSGICRYDGRSFTTYTTRNGLLCNMIRSLGVDAEGNTWIGSNTGLSCLHSSSISYYTTENGLIHNMVWAIMKDKGGNSWFGTEEGLSRLSSSGEFRHFTKKDGLLNNRVYALLEDRDGKIWIGTDGGLNVYHNEKNGKNGKFSGYTMENGLLQNSVESLALDRDGNIWIGTLAGLNVYSDNTLQVPRFDAGPVTVEIRTIKEDREGNIWLGSPRGLYRVTGQKITHFTTKDRLPSSSVFSIDQDNDGNLWIATERGLSLMSGRRLFSYTIEDGLPGNRCHFVITGPKGNVWVGTTNGLARFDGRGFKTYSPEEGFSRNWNEGVCHLDRDGALWFGSVNGVTCFNPSDQKTNAVPPPVFITDVKVLEQDMPFDALQHLRHNQNYIKFSFTGLSFTAPARTIFKYRLQGTDAGWRQTSAPWVAYAYLPPGDYRFQVKAVNNDGVESLKPAELDFRIQPPFYKAVWFQAGAGIFLATLVGFILFSRIKRIKEKMAYDTRTRQLVMAQKMELLGVLAAGAVHDLKNLLSVILGYSKLAERNARDEEKTSGKNAVPLEKIHKTASTAIQVVKQILTFTRQKSDEITGANLVDLLQDILDILNITRPYGVMIHWNPPGEPVIMEINPGRFQQLVMNLCLNAFQAMDEKGELTIALRQDLETGKKITLEIADTGTGIESDALPHIFEPLFTTKSDEKGTGLGLFVVKQIVDEYGGAIDVESETGKGTRFTVTFPLAKS